MRTRNTIFLSHREEDEQIAEVVRDHLILWGFPQRLIFNSHKFADEIPKKIKNSLFDAKIFIFIYTFDDYNWEWNAYELGVAQNPTQEPKIFFLQCLENDQPKMRYYENFKINLDNVKTFVSQMHEGLEFFSRKKNRLQQISESEITRKSKIFHQALLEVIPPNKKQIDLLRKGRKIWNEWRKKNPGVRPDLRGAILRNADLTEVDLRQANLYRADLSGTNLSKANLRDANLQRTNLTETKLGGAILTEALLGSTILGDTDLNNVKGLDLSRHFSPSFLDHLTISKSSNLPTNFFRGCGLNDWQIESTKLNNEDLTLSEITDIIYEINHIRAEQPLQFYSLFISYSSKDEKFIKKLHDDLQDRNIRCWYAPEDMRAGRKIHDQITDAIRVHDKLLVVLSEHSIKSPWVKTEIRSARKREQKEERQVLFPIGLASMKVLDNWELFDHDEGRDLAAEVRSYHIPNFNNWKDKNSYTESFERLIRDLKTDGETRKNNVRD